MGVTSCQKVSWHKHSVRLSAIRLNRGSLDCHCAINALAPCLCETRRELLRSRRYPVSRAAERSDN
jgi:hypothetical protein